MTANPEDIKPHFIIETDNPDNQAWLERFQADIVERPLVYIEALDLYRSLRDQSHDSVDPAEAVRKVFFGYLKENAGQTDAFGIAFDNIATVMKERLDKDFRYDLATENAIDTDDLMKRFKEEAKKSGSDYLVNRNRVERLAFFTGRIILKQSTNDVQPNGEAEVA